MVEQLRPSMPTSSGMGPNAQDTLLSNRSRATWRAARENNVTVWRAWLGPNAIPGYLQATCATTMSQLGPSATTVLLTDNNLEQYIPERNRHRTFPLLSFVHQADYVRAHILDRFGGVWLDMETIVLRNFSTQLHLCVEDGSSVPLSQSAMGPMVAGSPFVREWSRRVDETLSTLLPRLLERRRRHCGLSLLAPVLRGSCCAAYWHHYPREVAWQALLGHIWFQLSQMSFFRKSLQIDSCLITCNNFVDGGSCPVRCGILGQYQICHGRRQHAADRMSARPKLRVGAHVAIGVNSAVSSIFKHLTIIEFLRAPSFLAQIVRHALHLEPIPAVQIAIRRAQHCYHYNRSRAAPETRRRSASGPYELDASGTHRPFCHPALWPPVLSVSY